MSLELMKCITDELESIEFTSYPSYYNYTGYNSSDCFFLAVEAGIYKWMQNKCEEWKDISCPTVGIITTSPSPIPFSSSLKTEITIAPLANMNAKIPSPWGKTVIPGPLRLCTFLHQAFHPNYPKPSSVNTNPIVYSKAFFEAVCMWMNSLWLIKINDKSNALLTNASGTSVILFPGIKVMGDLFAKVCNLYKPKNSYVYFAIFSFFLMIGVQGNLTLPIPTIGTHASGPYIGLTCPLPFPIADIPALPKLPRLSTPNIILPEFTLPSFKSFTIPEYPGIPGLPDIRFAVPEINLDFILSTLELTSWSDLVEFLFDLKGFPFSLGEFKFWNLKDWEFTIKLPGFGPYSLDNILEGFGLTLPEFCILTNLFNLPSFTLPEMTILAWAPTVLLCSERLNESMQIINDNSYADHFEAFETGSMRGIALTGTYIPVSSATFENSINDARENAFNNADAYASNVSIYAIGSMSAADPGYNIESKYRILKPKIFSYKNDNAVPFVARY